MCGSATNRNNHTSDYEIVDTNADNIVGCPQSIAIPTRDTNGMRNTSRQAVAGYSRREFLTATLATFATAVAIAAASGNGAKQKGRNQVGSGLYGWSQYYSREGKDVNRNLDELLAVVRDCGFEFLEGFVDLEHPENNARLAERMRAKGLKPVCIYTSAALHEPAKEHESVEKIVQAAKVCHDAGFSIIDLNPNPVGREKTDEELKTQAASLNNLGAELKKIGMQLGIHNHMPEMANGAREFHFQLRQTEPKFVGFCYDVHWVSRGGIQPLDCLLEYGTRVVSWHIRQSRGGVWWEDLDTGDIDYAAVARFANAHHLAAPYSVELALEKGTKITRSAVENHRRSREFMRKVFGC
jgi:sugar phosphate isomerase/epimerase